LKPRIAVVWLELVLAVTGAAYGITILARSGEFAFESAVKIAGIPAAAAIAAGLFFLLSEDRKLPLGRWIAFVFPSVHIALIATVATLAGAHLTGIEKSEALHPAQVWSHWKVLIGAFLADGAVLGILVEILIRKGRPNSSNPAASSDG